MARLFVQYLIIYNNENLINNPKKIAKVSSTFCQILIKLSIFCQSGETLPNLVTLTTDLVSVPQMEPRPSGGA